MNLSINAINSTFRSEKIIARDMTPKEKVELKERQIERVRTYTSHLKLNEIQKIGNVSKKEIENYGAYLEKLQEELIMLKAEAK